MTFLYNLAFVLDFIVTSRSVDYQENDFGRDTVGRVRMIAH